MVRAERVPPEVALDERRLVLTLSEAGMVVAVGGSPEALFNFPPINLLGRAVDEVVDIFQAWTHEEGEGSSPACRLYFG